ncbi:RagB/SusD family nutrient uptake outer membrane protein [Sphingobacterium kyonggiense]
MKKTYLLFCLSLLMGLNSCNDKFLNRLPLDQPTEISVFTDYKNFQAYTWSLYATFPTIGYSEQETDNISLNWTRNTGESSWIRGNVTVPATSSETTWSQYNFIRKCNLMLDNIDAPQSKLSEKEKEHFRSLGLFFRAYRYFSLLTTYGGVPWIDHVLNNNSEENQAPRADRDVIAEHILADLQYAEQHIGDFKDGNNTVNLNVVQALFSRFTLFEGTWRKYHKLADAEKYLQECKRVSRLLIDRQPEIHPNYDDLFNSIDLANTKGILLYKEYNNAVGLTHAISISGTTNSESARFEPTRDLMDSYLCIDGHTRWTSPKFISDKVMEEEFSNRDRRLWLQVCPPYTINKTSGGWDAKWWFLENNVTENGLDSLTARMYIDEITKLVSNPRQKVLPFRQGYLGGILFSIPHYSFMRRSQPWYASEFGYNTWKYFNTTLDLGSARNEETDKPIFRIEETMLNYAEAMFELGEFDQAIADLTINRLRPRAGIAAMKVAEITSTFDPKRDKGDARYAGDYEVDPVLWEIRRERRIELFMEGFRFNDLRRWKKAQYALRQKKGQWVDKVKLRLLNKKGPVFTRNTLNENAFTLDRAGDAGYLTFHEEQTHLWPDYYYLSPLPLDQLVLNKNLVQNPGW